MMECHDVREIECQCTFCYQVFYQLCKKNSSSGCIFSEEVQLENRCMQKMLEKRLKSVKTCKNSKEKRKDWKTFVRKRKEETEN